MLNYLKEETNVTSTENGDRAFKTTYSELLDLFASGGALRQASQTDVVKLFSKALAEDTLLGIKSMFYFRDVRGGQGERDVFRLMLNYLAVTQPNLVKANIFNIPYYGRWDDMYALFDTPLEKFAADAMKSVLLNDINSEAPSLLAKWLKSENASSPETVALAKKTRKLFNFTPKQYRKILSDLRKRISIIETKLTERNYPEIDYSTVPSLAGLKYRQAFFRNDEERYSQFVSDAINGEVKVNTKALYPYEIITKITRVLPSHFIDTKQDEVLDMMWRNLPDYINGSKENAIAVVDTSGSMNGLPRGVALSLGIYMAERNHGVFKDHFITFSEKPTLEKIVGNNIAEKVRNMDSAKWGFNTNLENVLSLILDTAIKYQVPQSEMIKRLYIISDMQFDASTNYDKRNKSVFQKAQEVYKSYGYEFPSVVFWNVNAQPNNFPVTKNDYGVQLVSGCSPSIFTNLIAGKELSAQELMLDVLNSERYDMVVLG